MERRVLGRSGLLVSRLCYGTLTLGPSQSDKSPREGGELIAYALERGICFLDTAELYGTYAHIREALKRHSSQPVISAKSYAYDETGARQSVEKARKEMDVDAIDLFMLHEQENLLTMQGHSEALRYYLRMRDKGVIRAVGISTHAVEPVQVLLKSRDASFEADYLPRVANESFDTGLFREIDVVHPIINIEGLGLLDGSRQAMEQAVKAAANLGIGVFGMKILGGGNLLARFEDAFNYAFALDGIHSLAVGMQSKDEIDLNINLFNGIPPAPSLLEAVKKVRRSILIESWCTGCGECLRACKAGAIALKRQPDPRNQDRRAQVDPEKCLLCSYCARACPEFAIKVI